MKTRTTKKKNESTAPAHDDQTSREDVLAVLVDVDNGHEFYMSMIDSFQMKGHEYVVMYNYEPDDGRHVDPEITILRSERHTSGEQFYMSIKNRLELDAAFDVFYSRFEEAGGL